MTLKERLALAFSSKGSGNTLKKKDVSGSASGGENRKKSFQSSRSRVSTQRSAPDYPGTDNVDIQTGERRDDTALLHGLADRESNESLDSTFKSNWDGHEDRKPGEESLASLPRDLWEYISSYLLPSDAASLSFSSKTLHSRLGAEPWVALDQPANLHHKTRFLLYLDKQMPNHLLCFSCGRFHLRIQRGDERLKATRVLNVIVNCPNATRPGYIPPRARIAVGHTLPFTFVQLVMRAHLYSPEYGIPLKSLFRRWEDRDSNWKIETSYYIYRGHLLMRVVSRSFADAALPASAQRLLLYSPREDYTPYFSVCSHWRDGELMNVCKCALSHIPKPTQTTAQQLQKGPQFKMPPRVTNPVVSLCGNCRPMRRCPECPTEYLVELKFAEDKNDMLNKFKQVIVVTRWSDLGDGLSPQSPEWAAINGETSFDSFKAIKKRTISGIFESQSGVAIPGQRMVSLNPKHEKLGEDGHNWY